MPKVGEHWICPKCGLDEMHHSFAQMLNHVLNGAELRDGGTMNEEVAQDITDRIFERLLGPEEI